jgi:hypothetical protein
MYPKDLKFQNAEYAIIFEIQNNCDFAFLTEKYLVKISTSLFFNDMSLRNIMKPVSGHENDFSNDRVPKKA